MGHYLRYGVPCRLPKLLSDLHSLERRAGTNCFTRLLSVKSGDADVPLKRTSTNLDEEAFYEDVMKFPNENRISLPKSPLKPGDFLPGAADDPNTFGTLSKCNTDVLNAEEGSEDDILEDKFISELPKRLPQVVYANMIKKYLRQRRFADALAVLNEKMLKEHRVKPEYYIYSILIAYCGTVGYSKMAYKLFNEMKKRGLPVKDSVYTSLFNSFANSPYPHDGLDRTRNLLALMEEKGVHPNQMTCHAIIKAFGRCGAVEEAFKFVDYMMEKKFPLTNETMSFLFQACVSDKTSGFRFSILVYKKMMQYNMKPDAYNFNLLLRSVRDCGFGDVDSTVEFLKSIGVENVDRYLSLTAPQTPTSTEGYPWDEDDKVSPLAVTGLDSEAAILNDSSGSPTAVSTTSLLPNLFDRKPNFNSVLSLTQIQTPEDRLFLLGGVAGFLKEMNKFGAEISIKTLNLLLDCTPSTFVSEETLLKLMKKMNLKPDILFFNTIIHRRASRQHYSSGRDVLDKIAEYGLHPDIMTFTNLAMCCRTKLEACELLKAMEQCGLRPGIQLLTSLFGSATYKYNMRYVNFVLDVVEFEELKVNDHFLKKADHFYETCLRILKIKPEKFTPTTLDGMLQFTKKYPSWREAVTKEEALHPWQHLRERHTDTETDKEFFKDIEEHAPKPQFSRLGPNTAPKVRLSKIKEMKRENPDAFRKMPRRKSSLESLQGIDSVTYQNLK